MNCKPGDLAVVIDSIAGNEGKIVRCLRILGRFGCETPDGIRFSDFLWEIDKRLPDWAGELRAEIFDHQLQPIRPPRRPITEGRDMEVTV